MVTENIGGLFMWPQNILFFIIPAIVIILVFMLLPLLNKIKEPFGYKTKTPIKVEDFNRIKNIYFRKVLLFSIPFSLAVSISSMYTLSAFIGTAFLVALTFGLGAIDFLFYIQAYKSIKDIAASQNNTSEEPKSPEDIEELEKW